MTADAISFTKRDLEEADRAIVSMISKCDKVLPKLIRGTPQHTLLTRRLEALHVAAALIQKELELLSSRA